MSKGYEQAMSTVTLSLISHTNVGKTTLARTILRRDIGEVLDQAHVTEESEGFDLVADGDDALRLWDTPGLGDSARQVQELDVVLRRVCIVEHLVVRHRPPPELHRSRFAIGSEARRHDELGDVQMLEFEEVGLEK